jgi:hypothetical protein
VDTQIWRNIPIPFRYVFDLFRYLFLKNLQEGIQTTLYLMMSPNLSGITGKYFRDCKEGTPRKDVHNIEWQNILWEESGKIVQLTEKDPQI